MLPDERGQGTEIPESELVPPMGLGQNPLQHECVDIDHAVLQQMQAQRADLLVLL